MNEKEIQEARALLAAGFSVRVGTRTVATEADLDEAIDALENAPLADKPTQSEMVETALISRVAELETHLKAQEAISDAQAASRAQAGAALEAVKGERDAAVDLHSGLLKDYEGQKDEIKAAEAEIERIAAERDKAFADWQADMAKFEARIAELEAQLAKAAKKAAPGTPPAAESGQGAQ